MKKIVLLAVIFLPCILLAQFSYPAARPVDSADTYFGQTYPDAYRWLENLNDPAVQAWYKRQAGFTDSIINRLSGREALIAEWKKLGNLTSATYSGRYMHGNKIFYTKRQAGEKTAKLYYKKGPAEKEELLFDPALSLPDTSASFQSAVPSYDGSKVIIAYARGGSEISTLAIFDVLTKTFLPETIYPCFANSVYWCMDSKAFIYTALVTADNTSPEFLKNNRVKLHRFGQSTAQDADLFSNPGYPELMLQPQYFINGELTSLSPDHLFVNNSNNDGLNVYYVASAQQQYDGHIAWKQLSTKADQLSRSIDFIGDRVFAMTAKEAPNYRLISTSISHPDWSKPEIIAAEKKDLVLENFVLCKEFILLTYTNGINKRLFRYNLKTKLSSEIKLPYPCSAFVRYVNPRTNIFYVSLTSWNKPLTELKLNIASGELSASDFNLPAEYPTAYTEIEVEEVEVRGHDGVMIPLSILYKKGLKRDGSHVCFMESYGAYGWSMQPVFNKLWNSLVVKGIVVAIPHVRGGGEKGLAWEQAGMKTTKPNTWKDFNSCADYLIAKGFTAPKKIAGSGGSAGGIMISRAVTERPELYGAAISNVGVLNTLRSEKMPNGANLSYHFGTVKDSIECRALYEMDGLAHIKKNVSYPAFICVTGWNDPRVSSWQSGKFAAAMQAASSSGKPVLLKVNYDSGHFGSEEDYAGFWSFALWQCGHPDFQLKK